MITLHWNIIVFAVATIVILARVIYLLSIEDKGGWGNLGEALEFFMWLIVEVVSTLIWGGIFWW